jgi:lipid-binding SYLF domain-containing protein
MRDAKGLAILTVTKGGFIFSGRGSFLFELPEDVLQS